MREVGVLTNPKLEAREAFDEYRVALALTRNRSTWHRLLCWCRDPDARRAEHALEVSRRRLRAVARPSDAHRVALRTIAAELPDSTPDEDRFIALLCA